MELIERDAQLALLRACASAAAEGAGSVALVGGEAGIGKTSLVKELARQCPGHAVWWGACDALQTPSPLAPLHDIARSAHAGLGELLDRNVKGSALFAEVVRALQSAGPALFVIDDAHWADESTLDLILHAGRRIDRTQALMVVTFRQDEVSLSHPLRSVLGELPASITTRIELARLSEEGVVTLARRALRSPAGLHAATGGNPFFLTELLRHGSGEVPQSIQDLVLARFARLSPKAREIVQLAAIVPARIERWLVDQLLGPEASDVEECLDCGLLLVDDAHLLFRHELARVSIERAISVPVAESLHKRALDALAARGYASGNVARLVHHATHARAADAVVRYAPAAALQARERGARREAAAHYRTTLDFAAALPVEGEVEILEAFAAESTAIHRLCDAIDARLRIAECLRGKGTALAEGRNFSQLALDYVIALQNSDADAASRRAIRILEAQPPGVELANAYRVEAQLCMLNRDVNEAIEWGHKAIALAKRFENNEVLAAATGTVGAALLFIDYESGVDHLHRGLDLALEHGLDFIAANIYSNIGAGAGELYRLRMADRYLQSAIAFSTTKEIDAYRTYAMAWLGLTDLFLGRWDEAESHAQEVIDYTLEEVSTARIMALCAMGRLQVRRGDSDPEPALGEALRLAAATSSLQRIAPVRAMRAEAAFQRGEPERVADEASAALPLARAHRHPWHVGEFTYWLSRVDAAGARPEECAEPWRLHLRGDWRGAANAWAGLECPYEQARALADGDEAAKLQALAIYERLGARPAAEALRRTLRETGVRGVPRGPRSTTQRNPRGLTQRELEILDLLCLGMKNSEIAERLFRSVRTVEHHVDSILGKLGARSRAEVPAIARRDGLLDRMGSPRVQNT